MRAMESIAGQTRSPDQVVIVDDASTEEMSKSLELAAELGFEWRQLSSNRGPAAARNAGVAATSSDWVCFLDSDDEWLPDKLAEQSRWNDEHPEFSISQVHESWRRNGAVVKKPRHWEQDGGDLFAASIERCSIGPSCVMLSRRLWDDFGGFDEDFRVCEDYELWLRVCSQTEIGLVDSEPLVRKHAGHEDQLSVVTPAMDRFRVHALIKAHFDSGYSEKQKKMIAQGICEKSIILADGAAKRGSLERSKFYREVSEVKWDALRTDLKRKWFEHSKRFLQT